MVACSWEGLIGYLIALVFFITGIVSVIYMAYDAYKIGKKNGWFFLINKNDIVRRNPFNFLLFSSILIPIGCFLIYKIMTIIYKYWLCLSKTI